MAMYRIMVVGVGGQGILTFGRVLAEAALEKGYHVVMSEVHGMAQRGGSVQVHIKLSDKEIYSPLIDNGMADILVAFEAIEAVRYIPTLKAGGTLLTSDLVIIPPDPDIQLNPPKYQDLRKVMEESGVKMVEVPHKPLLDKFGTLLPLNMYMLGAMLALKAVPITLDDSEKAIKKVFKPKVAELNIQALKLGYEIASQKLH